MFEVDTCTYHYKSRRPGQAHLEQRIKEIFQTRVRYGYRRIHVLLRREGCRIVGSFNDISVNARSIAGS